MHSTKTLRPDSFTFEVNRQVSELSTVFPGFGEVDRLGVVVRAPCGGVGASHAILAAITDFYERQRARYDDFFVYPDFYLFHVGRRFGNHAMLDVFPGHKEVVVEDEPKSILQAVNDRRVTRLLVPDTTYRDPDLDRITLGSLHLTSALAYSATGRVDTPDTWVSGNAASRDYVDNVIDASADWNDASALAQQRRARHALEREGEPVESYRQIPVGDALGML